MDNQDLDNKVIYQIRPVYSLRNGFKEWRWTNSIVGYINEADKTARCLEANRKLTWNGYTLGATLNIITPLTIQEHKKWWNKFSRILKREGLIAFWCREPSKTNRIHYHFAISEPLDMNECEKIFITARKSLDKVRVWFWHDERKHQWEWCRYIVKAKTRLVTNSKDIADRWGNKRLLFHTGLGLDKIGAIGPFWKKPRAEYWRDIVKRERAINAVNQDGESRYVIEELVTLFDGCIPAHKVRRDKALHLLNIEKAKQSIRAVDSDGESGSNSNSPCEEHLVTEGEYEQG